MELNSKWTTERLARKSLYACNLFDILLYEVQVKEELPMDMRKYLELNDNTNMTYQSLWNVPGLKESLLP